MSTFLSLNPSGNFQESQEGLVLPLPTNQLKPPTTKHGREFFKRHNDDRSGPFQVTSHLMENVAGRSFVSLPQHRSSQACSFEIHNRRENSSGSNTDSDSEVLRQRQPRKKIRQDSGYVNTIAMSMVELSTGLAKFTEAVGKLSEVVNRLPPATETCPAGVTSSCHLTSLHSLPLSNISSLSSKLSSSCSQPFSSISTNSTDSSCSTSSSSSASSAQDLTSHESYDKEEYTVNTLQLPPTSKSSQLLTVPLFVEGSSTKRRAYDVNAAESNKHKISYGVAPLFHSTPPLSSLSSLSASTSAYSSSSSSSQPSGFTSSYAGSARNSSGDANGIASVSTVGATSSSLPTQKDLLKPTSLSTSISVYSSSPSSSSSLSNSSSSSALNSAISLAAEKRSMNLPAEAQVPPCKSVNSIFNRIFCYRKTKKT